MKARLNDTIMHNKAKGQKHQTNSPKASQKTGEHIRLINQQYNKMGERTRTETAK